MDILELKKIILQGEDSKTQFKLNFDSPDQLAAEIGAFANCKGGRIIIGVSDEGNIIGLEKSAKGWIVLISVHITIAHYGRLKRFHGMETTCRGHYTGTAKQ